MLYNYAPSHMSSGLSQTSIQLACHPTLSLCPHLKKKKIH
jgi:hypothetical protein